MNRYVRHIALPEIGTNGQKKISDSTVHIVGCGGLGVPVAQYLVGAGVGKLVLWDGDTVESHNIHRQPVYTEVGINKAEALANVLSQVNPEVDIKTRGYIDYNTSKVDFSGIIVDCTDDFAIKQYLSAMALHLGIPYITASVEQFKGQVFSGCLHCIFPFHTPDVKNCNDAGILSTAPAIIGTMQAHEVLKHITGFADTCNVTMDLKTYETKKFTVDSDCSVCRERKEPVCKAVYDRDFDAEWVDVRKEYEIKGKCVLYCNTGRTAQRVCYEVDRDDVYYFKG